MITLVEMARNEEKRERNEKKEGKSTENKKLRFSFVDLEFNVHRVVWIVRIKLYIYTYIIYIYILYIIYVYIYRIIIYYILSL